LPSTGPKWSGKCEGENSFKKRKGGNKKIGTIIVDGEKHISNSKEDLRRKGREKSYVSSNL